MGGLGCQPGRSSGSAPQPDAFVAGPGPAHSARGILEAASDPVIKAADDHAPELGVLARAMPEPSIKVYDCLVAARTQDSVWRHIYLLPFDRSRLERGAAGA